MADNQNEELMRLVQEIHRAIFGDTKNRGLLERIRLLEMFSKTAGWLLGVVTVAVVSIGVHKIMTVWGG